ncbi:MAG: hypothetical protein ABIH23_11105 [bacterium]
MKRTFLHADYSRLYLLILLSSPSRISLTRDAVPEMRLLLAVHMDHAHVPVNDIEACGRGIESIPSQTIDVLNG